MRSSCSTTLNTKPSLKASSASIISPVHINSKAFCTPTILGNLKFNPPSGRRPRFVCKTPNFASADAMRISGVSANPKPAPTAYPLIAPIIGLSHCAKTN